MGNAAIKSIPIIVIETPKVTEHYRSVIVKTCDCRKCSFAPAIFMNATNKCRSWMWLHFIKAATPPSVLLMSSHQLPFLKCQQRMEPNYLTPHFREYAAKVLQAKKMGDAKKRMGNIKKMREDIKKK